MKALCFLGMAFAAALAFAEIKPVAPEGSGKKDDPYLIDKLENFFWLSQASQEKEIYCQQTADIDASRTQDEEESSWPLIANYRMLVYDGQGYSIISPYISDSVADVCGLFSYGIFQIKNLNIKKAKANFERKGGAILVGEMSIDRENRNTLLSVENCTVDGEIFTSTYASGLIGFVFINDETATFIVSNCFSKINIQGKEIRAAGLINYISGFNLDSLNIYDSHASLTLNCEVLVGYGGLLGSPYISAPTNHLTSVNLVNCSSLIDVSSEKGNPFWGGGLLDILTLQRDGKIDVDKKRVCVTRILGCHSSGKTSIGKRDGDLRLSGLGGFIGVLNVYSFGSVIECQIENCYSDVNFDLYDDYGNTGGFIGCIRESNKGVYSPITINKCYASNIINISFPQSEMWEAKKPFIGYYNNFFPYLTVTNCYSNKDYFETEDEYAMGKSSQELRKESTFEGWDFDNVWDIDEGVSFPYLKNELPEPFSVGAFALALLIYLRLTMIPRKK